MFSIAIEQLWAPSYPMIICLVKGDSSRPKLGEVGVELSLQINR